jgi:hypothetical protein
MRVSPITATNEPEATDSPAGHTQMTDIVANLERFVIGRFASQSALNTAIPAPTTGMVAYVTSLELVRWNGTAWVPGLTRNIQANPVSTYSLTNTATNSGCTMTLPPGKWSLFAKAEGANITASPEEIDAQIYNQTSGLILDTTRAFANSTMRASLSLLTVATLTVQSIINLRGLGSAADGSASHSLNQIQMQAIAVS